MKQQHLLIDHHITLFYFFNYPCPLEKLTVSQITKQLPITIKPDKIDALWQPHNYNLSKDFILPIHQLFHQKPKAAINSWKINKQIVRKINQSKIKLKFSKSAQKRLDKNHPENKTETLSLYLDRILHHTFSTGFGITSVELHLQNKTCPLDTQHLNEALHTLTRYNTLEAENNTDRFTLGQLIRQLHDKSAITTSSSQRVYTHCYLQIDDSTPDDTCKQIANQLALHYTDDYQLDNDNIAPQSLKDFKNIIHVFSQEGSSSLIKITKDSPEILQDYYNKVICPVQQPIHLLSEHLQRAMQQYAVISTPSLNNKTKAKQKAKQLHAIQDQLLNFKLRYFNPVISQVSQHNQIQNKLYNAKRIDEQYQQLSNNTETFNKLINSKHQQRYCKLSSFGIAAAAYLTSFSIIKEAIEIIPEWPQLKKIAPQLSEILHHYHLSSSLAGSLFISLIILIISYRHCKHHEPHEHSNSHKLLEVLHARHPLHK